MKFDWPCPSLKKRYGATLWQRLGIVIFDYGWLRCPDCHGAGRRNGKTCYRCLAYGKVYVCKIEGEWKDQPTI